MSADRQRLASLFLYSYGLYSYGLYIVYGADRQRLASLFLQCLACEVSVAQIQAWQHGSYVGSGFTRFCVACRWSHGSIEVSMKLCLPASSVRCSASTFVVIERQYLWLLPGNTCGYYQATSWVITKQHLGLLPSNFDALLPGNISDYYQATSWVITRQPFWSLPGNLFGHYQATFWVITRQHFKLLHHTCLPRA